MSFFTRKKTPDHMRDAQKRLDDARLELTEHESKLEYYESTVPMLRKRIARLEAALAPQGDSKESARELGAPMPKPHDWDERNRLDRISQAPRTRRPAGAMA